MKIKTVGATNYRTLENFSLNLGENYCAISGRNNSGKTTIIKIIRHFFDNRDDDGFVDRNWNRVSFIRDLTQWSKADEMEIWVDAIIDRVDDSEAFFVVETYAPKKAASLGKEALVHLREKFARDGASTVVCKVDSDDVEGQGGVEILKKLRTVSNVFVYNSTQPSRRLFYQRNSFTEILTTRFSPDDKRKINEAEKTLQARVKRAAKQHKDDLDLLLGKLADKYHVELSTIDGDESASFPLEIKLNDSSVEVPLSDWGAGTQNRTRVLMAVLDAVKTRELVAPENRSTPVFLVEEPESFLHPSAQAEFGQVLNSLANELSIQIIATTHSPYMLNQTDPVANILLDRKVVRKKLLRETYKKDTDGESWMLPFAENLGVIPRDFAAWEMVFQTRSPRVVFVEGSIDLDSFEHFAKNYPDIYAIPDDVEIVPYDGVGALKNTSILKFMISKFSRVFVTYDLDCESEVKPSLERIGLVSGTDFCSVGSNAGGCDNIEGLLPAGIKQVVYADRHDLVSALTSQDSKTKSDARKELKKELLNEFKKSKLNEKDLAEFRKLFASIGRAF